MLAKAIKNKSIKLITKIQNKSIELCLLLSLPAGIGLIFASNEIVNSLFGYGSFNEENIKLTASALKYFGYGVPAFSLIKIMSNLFFARDNTTTPFKISFFVVIINISISLIYFREVGFLIIPIATSISTWAGVLIYIFILNSKNYLVIEVNTYNNLIKITFATFVMTILLIFLLNFLSENFVYNSYIKILYLLLVIFLAAATYFIICYLLGILKIKNYKTN